MMHQQETESLPSRRTEPHVDVARLAEIAASIARARPLWQRLIRHDPTQRGFMRIYSTAEVEAWILTWTEEQAVELHDHGGSYGTVMVVEGELAESFTHLATRAPLRQMRWSAGSTHGFAAGHVHDLQNRGSAHATSIHVYSPPLSSMTFYDHRADTFLNPVRVESIRPDDPYTHLLTDQPGASDAEIDRPAAG